MSVRKIDFQTIRSPRLASALRPARHLSPFDGRNQHDVLQKPVGDLPAAATAELARTAGISGELPLLELNRKFGFHEFRRLNMRMREGWNEQGSSVAIWVRALADRKRQSPPIKGLTRTPYVAVELHGPCITGAARRQSPRSCDRKSLKDPFDYGHERPSIEIARLRLNWMEH